MFSRNRAGISIHAPHAGSDAEAILSDQKYLEFQSTLPTRGATRGKRRHAAYKRFQSTLPTRGATRATTNPGGVGHISIHAPHAGSDAAGGGKSDALLIFQSTLPTRGATVWLLMCAITISISIHAPHAGSDMTVMSSPVALSNFNPRSPRGERLYIQLPNKPTLPFQSTLPTRGATCFS